MAFKASIAVKTVWPSDPKTVSASFKMSLSSSTTRMRATFHLYHNNIGRKAAGPHGPKDNPGSIAIVGCPAPKIRFFVEFLDILEVS
jgi:hypothetical protein